MPFSFAKINSSHRLTVYQLYSSVNISSDIDSALYAVAKLVQSFIAKCLYVKLPPEAAEFRSFEIKSEKGKCECISIAERHLWSVRFRFTAKNKWEWFYNVAMVEEDGKLLFGIKIETSAEISLEEAQEHLPLVTDLLAQIGLAHFKPISAAPWKIDDPAQVNELYKLVTFPHRNLPVIVISEVDRRRWNLTPTPPRFLINDDYLANQVAGYAHVVRLSYLAAFAWTDLVGKPWSIFDGACRVYNSNVDIENADPMMHPCNMKEKIWHWVHKGKYGNQAYTSFLIDLVRQGVSINRTNWHGLYFVPDARILASELELAHFQHVSKAPEREEALNHHIDALQRKLDSANEENEEWLSELDKAQEAINYYKNENISLRRQVNLLLNSLKRQKGNAEPEEIKIPRSYDGMGDWVRQHLAGRLVLHPRAERAVGKAEYSEPEMVYRGLIILANEYRDSRMGLDNDEPFRAALEKYGMDFSRSIAKTRAGEEGDTYYVNYPLGSNQRAFLQYHLRRGNQHENRRCMRIYFFWDEETSQVVVGWLPSHLNIRIT